MKSRQMHLRSRPVGRATPENFAIVELDLPAPGVREVCVRNIFMSVDPYMLGRMQGSLRYDRPFELNEVMEGEAVGQVVESRSAVFPVGSYVQHWNGWRDAFVSDGDDLRIIRPRAGVPLEAYLDVLGRTTGLAAYAGLFYIADLQRGESVFVSGAAGAVGSAACQLALALNCRVVGSAGSAAKVRWLEEGIGVARGLNYNDYATSRQFEDALREALPDGIDVYFENVGGRQLEAALWLMNNRGRIPLCGMIEYYETDYNNDRSIDTGPHNFIQIADRWLKVQGFSAPHYYERLDEVEDRISEFMARGQVRSQTTVVQGLENSIEALNGLFTGKNLGKMIVAVGP